MFENDLSSALNLRQILPYFQPIIDLRTGRVASFEVLARWCHPTRGQIPPSAFIPRAERLGLVNDLTAHLLAETAAAAAGWPRTDFSLAVNVSPTQLRDRTLIQQIHLAADAGLDLSRLTIEITESALIGNLDRARDLADELRSLDIGLALDDFGTGFSSLLHLQSLPFTQLKIDARFVQSMLTRRESRKIVAAIIGLGHALGLETVGEGVESLDQAEMLLRLGCSSGQGWFYGRPQPAAAVPILLDRQTAALASSHPLEQSTSPETCGLEADPLHRLAHLHALYAGTPLGLCLLDPHLRIISINQRLSAMHGIAIADQLGRRIQDVYPALVPDVLPAILRALKGESTHGLDLKFPSPLPNHSPTFARAFYQPVRDEAQEVIGISVAVMPLNGNSPAQNLTWDLPTPESMPGHA